MRRPPFHASRPVDAGRRALLVALGGGAAAGLSVGRAAAAAVPAATASAALPTLPTAAVWKSPTCGCCHDWITHMQSAGFAISVHDTGNTAARARLGIAMELGSCHTALVDGYAIEGHVPAADVLRLLRERPRAVGLAVPGMPVGSPGMDGPAYGGRRDAYDVLLVERGGRTRVWSRHAAA